MLTDCIECWETPCRCGHDYKGWSQDEIIKFFNNILQYHNKQQILK